MAAREPYVKDGRVVIEDPHVAEFGTDAPPTPPRDHCCTHPGTGICMCDCHDWECDCYLTGSVLPDGWEHR